MRVNFSSDHDGSGNGFKIDYEIRRARREDIPSVASYDEKHCGGRIEASDARPNGHIHSPGYANKYKHDVFCFWEIVAREGRQILLTFPTGSLELEGEMSADGFSCQKAVIRITDGPWKEICGTEASAVAPILTQNNTVRITFFTAPDKVNGLKGFNLTWTEVRMVQDMSQCAREGEYMCSYTRYCIDASLRCNGDENCGEHDDSDEARCEKLESRTDKTIIIAMIFCGGIFFFITGFFCILFKKKLERKKKKKRHQNSSRRRQRQPYRQQKPVGKHTNHHLPEASELGENATSRFVHHDATGILPPINLQSSQLYRTAPPVPPKNNHVFEEQTFYG